MVDAAAAIAPEALRPGAAHRGRQVAILVLAAVVHMVPIAAAAAAAVWSLVAACRDVALMIAGAAAQQRHGLRSKATLCAVLLQCVYHTHIEQTMGTTFGQQASLRAWRQLCCRVIVLILCEAAPPLLARRIPLQGLVLGGRAGEPAQQRHRQRRLAHRAAHGHQLRAHLQVKLVRF